MMHDPVRRTRAVHLFGCHCRDCTPPVPADRHVRDRFGVNDHAAWILAGTVLGLAIVAVLHMTGLGPRLFHALGLL
jgi:hypothetical protein